jgi:hypothetical protein
MQAGAMEELRAAGLQPDLKTYKALVFAYGNDNNFDMVEVTKEEMRHLGLLNSFG